MSLERPSKTNASEAIENLLLIKTIFNYIKLGIT